MVIDVLVEVTAGVIVNMLVDVRADVVIRMLHGILVDVDIGLVILTVLALEFAGLVFKVLIGVNANVLPAVPTALEIAMPVQLEETMLF